jgi:hypothetical protein
MRIAYLLFLVPVAFSNGCAYMIAQSGIDLSEYKSKEAVHAEFGEPYESGSTEGVSTKDQFVPRNAAFYEDYITRRKLSTPFTSVGYAMGLSITLGAIEPFLVAGQLFLISERTILGQKLRFVYDTEGNVLTFYLNGESVYQPHH